MLIETEDGLVNFQHVVSVTDRRSNGVMLKTIDGQTHVVEDLSLTDMQLLASPVVPAGPGTMATVLIYHRRYDASGEQEPTIGDIISYTMPVIAWRLPPDEYADAIPILPNNANESYVLIKAGHELWGAGAGFHEDIYSAKESYLSELRYLWTQKNQSTTAATVSEGEAA